MIGLIISNGSIDNYDKLKRVFKLADYTICADGGLRHLRAIGEVPDIVLGDLDSIKTEDRDYIKRKNIDTRKFPPIKDNTDTDLCLDFLLDMGCSKVYFLGATGDRIDHTLANIFLLSSLLEKGVKGVICDDKNDIYLSNTHLEIKGEDDSFISVIPISENGAVISISGCFYNLDKVSLPFSSTRGISNEIVDKYASITIHKGKALIIKAID